MATKRWESSDRRRNQSRQYWAHWIMTIKKKSGLPEPIMNLSEQEKRKVILNKKPGKSENRSKSLTLGLCVNSSTNCLTSKKSPSSNINLVHYFLVVRKRGKPQNQQRKLKTAL